MPVFYIVATPIGNLEDISQRAIRTLSEVDLILAEDTRVTKKLLNYYNIETRAISYHQHSNLNKVNHILDFLEQDKDIALVSDAGTPGISDPGNKLIDEIIAKFGDKVKIIPIPGPSALISAGSISGLSMDKFSFMGFPPSKKKRKKFFEKVIQQLRDLNCPIVFYESTHRIIKTLQELGGLDEQLSVVVCRELTKKFETIYRGTIGDVARELEQEGPRGEFVVILAPKQKSCDS